MLASENGAAGEPIWNVLESSRAPTEPEHWVLVALQHVTADAGLLAQADDSRSGVPMRMRSDPPHDYGFGNVRDDIHHLSGGQRDD